MRKQNRLLLHIFLGAICFNSGNIAAQAQTQQNAAGASIFYEKHDTDLDTHALDMLKKHLQRLEETHAPDSEILPVMSAMAILLRGTPDRKHSIELFKKCLEIREKLGDQTSDDYKADLSGYAEAAFYAGDPLTAEDMILKLIPLSAEYDVKHRLKFNLVDCYTSEKNLPRAEHLMLETLKQNDSVGQCFSSELLGAGEWYAIQQRFDEAKSWYLKALARAKTETDKSAVKQAERALSKFFVKDSKPTDVTALLKKSPPQISLGESSAKFDLGGEGGLHYGCNYSAATAASTDGKADAPDNLNNVADWMKEYREALKHLNQKHYQQAEFQFKTGVEKYRQQAEEMIFTIGLAKTYQEMKDQTKLRDTIATLAKSQENVGPPALRPIAAVSKTTTSKVETSKSKKTSK